MKKLRQVIRDAPAHWVGDGFPVRTLISAHRLGAAISPFLLLDYAGPKNFDPSPEPRGVEEHPHRGLRVDGMWGPGREPDGLAGADPVLLAAERDGGLALGDDEERVVGRRVLAEPLARGEGEERDGAGPVLE